MEFDLLFQNVFKIPSYSLFNIIRQDKLKEIDQEIEKFVDKNKTVGLAVGISYRGQKVFAKGYGYQDRENKIKVSVEKSLFRWASMSKMITSIIALKLKQEGLLDFNMSIDNWFKEYKRPKKIIKQCELGQTLYKHKGEYYPCLNGFVEFDVDPEQDKSMQWITPQLLLSNRSGICSYDNTPYQAFPTDEEMKNPHLHNQNFADFFDYFIHKPFVCFPGEEYQYSTFGFNLLGRILELSSGTNYMDLVNKYIKDNNPGSNFKTLIPDRDKDKHLYPDRCKGYSKDKLTEDTDVSFKLPGGGFMSNLEDALEFCHKVSNLSTYEKLLLWSKTDSFSSYGLGFMVWEQHFHDFSIGHTGSQQKTSTFLKYYPHQKICFVALSNDEDFKQRELRNSIHKNLMKL